MNALAKTSTSAAATLTDLSSKLEPAAYAQIREAVVRMLAAFPAAGASDQAHGEMVANTYTAALTGLPLWAITGAGKAFLRGAVDGYNPAFRPTAPQWAQEARRQTESVYSEIKWHKARLAAPKKPTECEEMRDAIKAKFKTLEASMRAKSDPKRACQKSMTWEDQEAILLAEKQIPVTVSPSFIAFVRNQETQSTERLAAHDAAVRANGGTR